MTQEIINVGALPNDGEGDPLRTAFTKINNNFTQLFSTDFSTSEAYTTGTGSQVIFEAPVNTFTQGVFQINSIDTASANSQNITLTASVTNNQASLRWNGHSTLFSGDPITRYDMDVTGANIRIISNPIVDSTLYHFIASQITFSGVQAAGLTLALDGYPTGSLLGTENGLDLATQT